MPEEPDPFDARRSRRPRRVPAGERADERTGETAEAAPPPTGQEPEGAYSPAERAAQGANFGASSEPRSPRSPEASASRQAEGSAGRAEEATPTLRRAVLAQGIEFELADGSVYRVVPGPRGHGFTVLPVSPARQGMARPLRRSRTRDHVRGRKPGPDTVALRERLARDAAEGDVAPEAEYVEWLVGRGMVPEAARRLVHREALNLRSRET